jgi:hypothetical protein
MSCVCESISAGIAKECSNNVGGIKKMYVTEKCNVSSYTLSSPGDEISTITMSGGASFYEYVFNKNTCFFTESENNDEANGTTLVTQTITLVLNRREKTKRDNLMLLNKFKELVIIITDSNDINWLFGETNGVVLKTNEGGSGTAKTDRNGYTLTFVGEEPELANTVTDAALAAVI